MSKKPSLEMDYTYLPADHRQYTQDWTEYQGMAVFLHENALINKFDLKNIDNSIELLESKTVTEEQARIAWGVLEKVKALFNENVAYEKKTFPCGNEVRLAKLKNS